MNPYAELGIIVLVIFAIILAILWIMLPFLIMGTNRRLDKLIQQNERLLGRAGQADDEADPPEGLLERLAEAVYKEK
jgi:hypothetical protein